MDSEKIQENQPENTGPAPPERQKKAAARRGWKSLAIVPLILLYAVLIVWGTNRLVQRHAYYAEQIVASFGRDPVSIYYSPDDNAAKAAANYLAFSMEQTLGYKSELVVERDEDFRGISILCGTETPVESEQKAAIIFTAAAMSANAAEDELGDTVYSLRLEDDGVHIMVPERADCFGAVKAIADCWLQTNCGITGDGELVISRAMIDGQLSGLPTEVTGQFRILTQNLRNRDDGDDKTIKERAERFFRLVEVYQPDLIGTQEATWQWMELLEENLSDRYELFGCSRLGPDTKDGEWNTILYRKDRFSFVDGDTFWLSNTPTEPATKLNYDGSPRICTWSLLQNSETGNTLLFSNTHLHHPTGDFYRELRARQVEILLQKLHGSGDMITNYPSFLTGDFNGPSDEPFYTLITKEYDDAQTIAITDLSEINYSFHNYGASQALIDYCFCSPQKITVLDYQILDDWYEGYVSDHYGILITSVINN